MITVSIGPVMLQVPNSWFGLGMATLVGALALAVFLAPWARSRSGRDGRAAAQTNGPRRRRSSSRQLRLRRAARRRRSGARRPPVRR